VHRRSGAPGIIAEGANRLSEEPVRDCRVEFGQARASGQVRESEAGPDHAWPVIQGGWLLKVDALHRHIQLATFRYRVRVFPGGQPSTANSRHSSGTPFRT
jgi:hypothetical protein